MEGDIGLVSSPLVYLFRSSSWAAHLTDLAISISVVGLLAIKGAQDIETRLNEVEKLLETVISMPCKVRKESKVGREARVPHHHPDSNTAPPIPFIILSPLEVLADNQGKEDFVGFLQRS